MSGVFLTWSPMTHKIHPATATKEEEERSDDDDDEAIVHMACEVAQQNHDRVHTFTTMLPKDKFLSVYIHHNRYQ